MRYFIILLLFIVFFLAGTVFGIDRNQTATNSTQPEENDVLVSEQHVDVIKEKDKQSVDTTNVSADIVNMEDSPSMMQRTASFLGAGVKNIFEMLALVLYQIAKAFF